MITLALGTGVDADARWRRGHRTAPPADPGARPPLCLVPPAIVGPGRVGAPLRADPGVWEGDPDFAFRWLRDGTAIAGADAQEFTPGPPEDGTRLRLVVIATNAWGESQKPSENQIDITYAPPAAAEPLPDLALVQHSGEHSLDASTGFTGSALTFGVSGEGVAIDPDTGLLTILTDTLRDGVTVEVTATNSGGTATNRFTLTITAAVPDELEAPALVEAPALLGAGHIGTAVGLEPGVWSGTPDPELAFQWLIDGDEVAGADAAEYGPEPADDGRALACRVTATNAAGSAEAVTEPLVVSHAPPAVTGELPDLVLEAGNGPQSVEAAAAFSGEDLTYDVEGAGATVEARTGVIAIPTDAPIAGEAVTVTAANSGGSAATDFVVTVEALDGPEAPEIGPDNAELLVSEGPEGAWYITARLTDPTHPLHPAQGGVGRLHWTHQDGSRHPTGTGRADQHPAFADPDSPYYGCWWCRISQHDDIREWADKRTSGVGAEYEMVFAWSPDDPAQVALEDAEWVDWGDRFEGADALVIYDPASNAPPPAPQAGDWEMEQFTVQA